MGTSPFYVNQLLVPLRNKYICRSHMALEIRLRKRNLDKMSNSFLGPSIWNNLSNDLEISNNATLFSHDYKKLVLKSLSEYSTT